MTVSNLKTRQGFFWIPPPYTADFKITVERSDGTLDDITDLVHYIRIFDGVTDVVGEFEFKIYDPNETYKNVWTGNEIVRYYSDYSTNPTTLRFRGRVEKPSNRNNELRVWGRSESAKFLTLNVTKSYTGTSVSDILEDLVTTYGGGDFTTNNVESSNTNITVNWFEKPFWECVQELCTSAGFDCYVDSDRDFNFFEVGSRSNMGEAIVDGTNMLTIGDFSPDLTQIRNKVKVYGASLEGTQLIYTSSDTTSISSYGTKTEIVRDDNITSQTQIEEIAAAKLAQLKDPPTVGDISCFMLSTLQPGEQIYLSSQQNNIPPQLYDILSYTHEIDLQGEGLKTTVNVQREARDTATVFKSIIRRLNQTQDTSINPFQMDYTYTDLFNTDSGTHTNTEITGGILKLQTGQATGTWVSATQTSPVDIGEAYLILNGTNLSDVDVRISVDGGVSYSDIDREERIFFSNTGKNLRVEVTLSDSTARLDSISIQYKE